MTGFQYRRQSISTRWLRADSVAVGVDVAVAAVVDDVVVAAAAAVAGRLIPLPLGVAIGSQIESSSPCRKVFNLLSF